MWCFVPNKEFLITQKTRRGCAHWAIENAQEGYKTYLESIVAALSDTDTLTTAGLLGGEDCFLLPAADQVGC